MTERKDTNGEGRPKARRMGTRPKVQCFVGSMFSAERSKRWVELTFLDIWTWTL